MKTTENKGLFVDLNSEEMIDLNGGGKVLEYVIYGIAWTLGALSKAQQMHPDGGQWLA